MCLTSWFCVLLINQFYVVKLVWAILNYKQNYWFTAPGLYSYSEGIDFGILRTLDEPATVPINLVNTGGKPLHINVSTTCIQKTLILLWWYKFFCTPPSPATKLRVILKTVCYVFSGQILGYKLCYIEISYLQHLLATFGANFDQSGYTLRFVCRGGLYKLILFGLNF